MDFAQAILNFFGFAVGTAYSFLTQDLQQFAPDVAAVMLTLNQGLQAFSYALLVILTLWNVVKTTSSYAELKRPEVLVKMLIRFILTKYFISAAWSLVNGIFVIVGALIGAVFSLSGLMNPGDIWASMTVPSFGNQGIAGIISDVVSFINPLSKIPGLLLGLIAFIIAIVLSVTLILTVFGRFFKIYMFTALSPIPLSTFGSESTQEVGRNFIKSFCAVSLEGLIIGLALIVFSAYAQNPIIPLDGLGIFDWIGTMAGEITYIFTLIFNMLLLMGIIKGSDQIVHRMFGF